MGPTPDAPPKPAPAGRGRARSASASGSLDRRTLILSGAVLAGVILVGLVVVAVTVDPGPRRDTQGQAPPEGARPHIIPRPGEGAAPTDGGDRGGWEQLTLFALILGSIGAIGVVVFRGGSQARANRAAWRAAGTSDADGAVDTVGTHTVAVPRAPPATAGEDVPPEG
jgi:hypothetical protein